MSASASETRDGVGKNVSRVAALVLVFSMGAAAESLKMNALRDPEIWRHLRVGNWILENRAWPRTGLFSQAATQPWRDFNWGYDVLSAALNRVVGLLAIPALLMAVFIALGIVTFALAGGRRNFWSAIAVSVVAQYVLGGLLPSGSYGTVLLFGIELVLLERFRSSGDLRFVYGLPVLFLFWANMDIGFWFGIACYFLFVLDAWLQGRREIRIWEKAQTAQPKAPLWTLVCVGIACLAATLINPYGIRAYPAFLSDQSDALNVNLPGYGAMGFHRAQDYALLLLAMMACLILGWKRSRQLFPLGLLIGSMILAFRAERSGWLLALASTLVIGEALSGEIEKDSEGQAERLAWQTMVTAAATAVIVSGALLFARGPSTQKMMGRVAQDFPVQACDYLRTHELPQPLFNVQKWGSFLTWCLPEYPVAIDGRRGLYSEGEESGYYKVMRADAPIQSYAAMRQARTLLLEKNSVMGEALRDVPGFRVSYEDSLSIVYLQERKD